MDMRKEGFQSRLVKEALLLNIISFAALMVLICLVVGSLIYRNKASELNAIARYTSSLVEEKASAINDCLFRLQVNTSVKSNLNISDDLEKAKAKRVIQELLSTEYLGNRGIRDISIIDTQKNTYSIYYGYVFPDVDIADASIYQKSSVSYPFWTKDNELYNLFGVYYKENIDDKFFAAAPIIDYAFGKQLGLIVVTMDESYLLNVFQKSVEQPSKMEFYLISADKTSIVAANGDLAKQIDIQKMDFSKDTILHKWVNDSLMITLYLDSMDWYLVCATDLSFLYQAFFGILGILATILTIMCFFTCVLSDRRMRELTDGFKRIMDAMKLLQQGDFTVQIRNTDPDEIGELSRFLDRMVENLGKLVQERSEQERAVNRAELKALQSQINPHFLYNTMDILHWRLIEKNEEELSKGVVSLGNLLRYAMQNEENTTLANEVENTAHYISAISTINGKKISTLIQVESAEQIYLPKLTLQPIVENSVIHGFRGRTEGNEIEIIGKRMGRQYHLSIWDNGIGFHMKENGIGLENVRKRMEYLYGVSCKVAIASTIGEGTLVQLDFPLEIEA